MSAAKYFSDKCLIPCIQSQIESNVEKIDEINEALKSSPPSSETGITVEEIFPTHVPNQSLGIECEDCDNTIAFNQLSLHCNTCDLFFHKYCTDKKEVLEENGNLQHGIVNTALKINLKKKLAM